MCLMTDSNEQLLVIDQLRYQEVADADESPDLYFSLKNSHIRVAQWETAERLRASLTYGAQTGLLAKETIMIFRDSSNLMMKIQSAIKALTKKEMTDEESQEEHASAGKEGKKKESPEEHYGRMMIDEAMTNGIRRRDANGKWSGKGKANHLVTNEDFQRADITYGIILRDGKPCFAVYVEDTGAGFHPGRAPNPTHIDNILESNGRGMLYIETGAEKLGAHVAYLPMFDSPNPEDLRSRELLIDIPLSKDMASCMQIFNEWHASYVPKPPEAVEEQGEEEPDNDDDEVEDPTLPYEEQEEEKEITKELETIEFPPGMDEDPPTIDLPPGAMEDPPTIEHPTIVKDEPPVVDDEAKTVTQDEPPMPLSGEEDDDSQNI